MLQTNPSALNYGLRSESTKTLKDMILDVATIADLDEERVQRRITVASKSPYGRIPGLVNLFVSMALWPVEGRDFSGVSELKEEILAKYNLDEELLIDIKDSKGFHTFLNDDHELIKGQEPDLEEYEMLVTLFCTQLEIPVIDFRMTQAKWQLKEDQAIEAAELDMKEAELALSRYKSMTEAA